MSAIRIPVMTNDTKKTVVSGEVPFTYSESRDLLRIITATTI